MATPPTRSIWGAVLKNFINSFKPRQFKGTLIGSDYFGNKYFEILSTASLGNRRQRWFEPPKDNNFMQEMPAEWEAWLRYRRKHPPSEEEVMKNLALMQIKKKNALEVDKKAGAMTPAEKGFETFPKRPEYEMVPGKKSGN